MQVPLFPEDQGPTAITSCDHMDQTWGWSQLTRDWKGEKEGAGVLDGTSPELSVCGVMVVWAKYTSASAIVRWIFCYLLQNMFLWKWLCIFYNREYHSVIITLLMAIYSFAFNKCLRRWRAEASKYNGQVVRLWKVGPGLASGNLDVGWVPTPYLTEMTHCA